MGMQICHTALLFLLVATAACVDLSDHSESCAVPDDESSKGASMLQTRQRTVDISGQSGEASAAVPNPVTSLTQDRSQISSPTSAVCDWQCYLDRNPDLQKVFGPSNTAAAATHWANRGEKEGRDCTCSGGSGKDEAQVCNWQCYLNNNPDLQKVFGPTNTAAAARHWASNGQKEGRDCTCKDEAQVCNWQCYLVNNPDLQKAFGPTNTAAAARHWTKNGEKEGRVCTCQAPTVAPVLTCEPLPQLTGFDVSGCSNVKAGSKCTVPCSLPSDGKGVPSQEHLLVQFVCGGSDAEAGRHPTLIEEPESQPALVQKVSQRRLDARQWVHAGLHFFAPHISHLSLLTYFKQWVHGRFSSKVFLELRPSPQQSLLEEQRRRLSSTSMVAAATELLRSRQYKECPELVTTPEAKIALQVVQAETVGGVQHTLYLDTRGLLQHVAARLSNNGSVFDVTFDPPACQTPQFPAASMTALLQGLPDDLHTVPLKLTGEMELMALDDPLVSDCIDLFHRTAEENCERGMDFKVISARSFVINGLAVELEAKVCNTQGACFVHHPTCAFQVPPSPDASLLQLEPNEDILPEEDDMLPEEEKGLIATVVMHTHICLADQKDGVDSTARHEASLMEKFGMGELSRYKGFEHVNDPLPKWGALQVGELPGDIDFRTKYSVCFPSKDDIGPGTEVIRNQGLCGSCWVFTTASAAMNNICTSSNGAHSLRNPADRFEISSQKIMSCPAEGKDMQYGCRGGNVLQFDLGARFWGLTREKENPFQCGGGNPLHHFDEVDQSCSAFPWGGYCYGAADQNWFWGGAASVVGEYSMMTYVSQGLSLYASIDVYANFVAFSGDSIYSSTSGEKKAGHALTLIGYGSQGGSKYWHVQNSWGIHWGNNGFAKYLRGSNLAAIEEGAFVIRAWAKGGSVPPCLDSDSTGIIGPDGEVPCSDVIGAGYGNLCEHAEVGEHTRLQCPQSCGTCVASNGADAKPSPPPGGSGESATTPTAMPSSEMDRCISNIKSLLSAGGSSKSSKGL